MDDSTNASRRSAWNCWRCVMRRTLSSDTPRQAATERPEFGAKPMPAPRTRRTGRSFASTPASRRPEGDAMPVTQSDFEAWEARGASSRQAGGGLFDDPFISEPKRSPTCRNEGGLACN